jgi:hypothetical protein
VVPSTAVDGRQARPILSYIEIFAVRAFDFSVDDNNKVSCLVPDAVCRYLSTTSIVFVPPALKEERRVSSVVVATRRVCRGTDVLPGAVPSQPPLSIKFTSVAQTRRWRSELRTRVLLGVLVLQQAESGNRLHRAARFKPRLSKDSVCQPAFRNTRTGLVATLLLAYCTETTYAYIY